MFTMLLILIILGVVAAALYHTQAAQVVGYGILFLAIATLCFISLPLVMIVVACCIIGVIITAVAKSFIKQVDSNGPK